VFACKKDGSGDQAAMKRPPLSARYGRFICREFDTV
jgi:hypothetical protein